MNVLGKCSECGGDVVMPTVWGGVIPPTPTCSSCGAVMCRQVIPMEKRDEMPNDRQTVVYERKTTDWPPQPDQWAVCTAVLGSPVVHETGTIRYWTEQEDGA